jgi:hypothetical protein
MLWIIIMFVFGLFVIPMGYSLMNFGPKNLGILDESFAKQQAMVHGQTVPAAQLTVLYRWSLNLERGRHGGIQELDANWLCRSTDGEFVLGIVQGVATQQGWPLRPGESTLHLTWTWRSLTEEQVRHMLVADRKAYRAVFGAAQV